MCGTLHSHLKNRVQPWPDLQRKCCSDFPPYLIIRQECDWGSALGGQKEQGYFSPRSSARAHHALLFDTATRQTPSLFSI